VTRPSGGSGPHETQWNRDDSAGRHHDLRRGTGGAEPTGGEGSNANAVPVPVRTLDPHLQRTLHIDRRRESLDPHRRVGVGAESQEKEGSTARHRRVAGGVRSSPDRVLEEKRQGMQPGPCRGRVEVQNDRHLGPRGHTADDPRLPVLAEELSHHLEGTSLVVSVVGHDDADLEPGRPTYDLSRDLEPSRGMGALDR